MLRHAGARVSSQGRGGRATAVIERIAATLDLALAPRS
jgi:hypothetical protein